MLDFYSVFRYNVARMQRYRSGHNGADSKSVWAQAHVGSNPTLSAKQGGHPREGVPALFGGDDRSGRTHGLSAAERRKVSFHAIQYGFPLLFVGREMAGSIIRGLPRMMRRIPIFGYIHPRPCHRRIVVRGVQHSRPPRTPCFGRHRFTKTPHWGVFAR